MPTDDYPRAQVRVIDGQLVLDDPDALAMIKAVAQHNCGATLTMHADAVRRFALRVRERNLSTEDVVIVLLNVDDPHGRILTDVLMPGQDQAWQATRDQGQVPFARGLAARKGIEEVVSVLDAEVGERLKRWTQETVVVVMDHGVVEVFNVTEFAYGKNELVNGAANAARAREDKARSGEGT